MRGGPRERWINLIEQNLRNLGSRKSRINQTLTVDGERVIDLICQVLKKNILALTNLKINSGQ